MSLICGCPEGRCPYERWANLALKTMEAAPREAWQDMRQVVSRAAAMLREHRTAALAPRIKTAIVYQMADPYAVPEEAQP